MARVTYVKAARGRKNGRNRRCFKCGTEIRPGDPYKWFANRIGRYSQRKDCCHSCQIRASDKTTSPHLATIYAAQEAAEDALGAIGERGSLNDLAEIMRECAQGYREASESYGESADNIEQGFGHETYQSQEIREKSEACESAADELESAADNIESKDDPDEEDDAFKDDFDASGEYEGEVDNDGEPIDACDYTRALHDWAELRRDERWEEAFDEAEQCISEGVQV